jgi:predicted MFS family arabinose efflux permease
LALVFLGALLDTPGNTARDALLPDLAQKAGMPLERAASINHVIERSSRLIGAPLAGALIALIGTANVLWLDAISFLVSAGLIWFLVQASPIAGKPVARPAYWQEIRHGLQFVMGERLLLAIVVVVMLTNFLDAAFGGVVQPVYVKQVYEDALPLGLLIATNGAGAIVGALIFGWIGHRLPRHAVFTSMFFITGLRFLAYAVFPPLWALLLATFICSLGAGPLNPIISAVSYERIPENMRGRVFGLVTASAWAAIPLSTLAAGVLTERLGVQPMLVAIGVLYLGTTLSMAFIPSMRLMNERRPTAQPRPAGSGMQ